MKFHMQVLKFRRDSDNSKETGPQMKENAMGRFRNFVPTGVIPACILPFHGDLSLDLKSLKKHLQDVAAVDGLSAITINAHSTEVGSCTLAEQSEVMRVAGEAIGDRLPIVHGIYAEGSFEAARIAKQATSEGASALLVFPPGPFTLGQRAEMVVSHFRHISDATDLPLIAFQYPLATGQGYPRDTLNRLLDEVPAVLAIKDWCNNVPQHERHVVELQSRPIPVNVLTTHSAWLFSSLVLGCNGLLSGSGSVIADLQSALFKAVQANDLQRAKIINGRIRPLAQAFYAEPAVDMHNRMKEALVMLGRIPNAAVRPPLEKLSSTEVDQIRHALVKAGMLDADTMKAA
jgi:4-hydroxy-tetrahydrodipicolinate synthase